jgi:predicted dehydrogenase
MSEATRVGIIGLGAIGTVHARALQTLRKQAEIAAMCDVDQARLAERAKEFEADRTFTDYRALLDSDVEAVLVCVGNALHCEVAVAALQAGKKVFLEKPMAMNASEARAIAGAAESTAQLLQIGMIWRFEPQAAVVREWVQAGRLGEIYHIRIQLNRRRGIPGLGGWFTTKAQSGGGPMIDVGVHVFDAAMYLADLWNPTRVSAKTYAKFGPRMGEYRYVGMWAGPPKLEGVFDVEDYSTGFVRFGDAATMVFDISWAANRPDESYVELLGSEAGVRAYPGNQPLVFYTEHAGRPADITPQFPTNVNRAEAQMRSFVEACRGEHPPLATAEQGVTVMQLIDAIYASSDAGADVSIG